MAVSLITLENLRAQVLTVLRKIDPAEFNETEVDAAINAAAGKIYGVLGQEIRNEVYGSKVDLNWPTESNLEFRVVLPTASSVCKVWDIIAVKGLYTVDTTVTQVAITRSSMEMLTSLADNYYITGVIYYTRIGDYLYFSEDLPTGTSKKARVYYIRKLIEMADDTDTLDMPAEFRRLVILQASADLVVFAKDVNAQAIQLIRQEMLLEARNLGMRSGEYGQMTGEADSDPTPGGGSRGDVTPES